ncbi:MAG: hypothetical protein LUC94_01300, partial [Clostridiales bacterium]|nr:hypothetical protein [Clostridiales bacterium]
MKTCLYISYMDLGSTGTLGIENKVFGHIRTIEESGYISKYIIVKDNTLVSNLDIIPDNIVKDWSNDTTNRVNDLLLKIDLSGIDLAYVRFSYLNISSIKAFKKMKQQGVRIILEIPT